MSTTTTELSTRARDHRDARFRDIAARMKALSIFYISQQESRSATVILARRFQHPNDPSTQLFRETITPTSRKSAQVSQYIDRIEEINRAIVPISSSSSPSSSKSSAPPPSFLVAPDPYLAEGFKRSLALQKMKIPKLKPRVDTTVELEEGEIVEDAPVAKPTPSTSRPVGGNITNATSMSLPARPMAGNRGASGLGAGRATAATSPSGRVPASSSSLNSRTTTKENERYNPRPNILVPSAFLFQPPISKKAPAVAAPSSSQTQSSKKATPVMASSPISISTSRIVTMSDIIRAINPAYILPDSMPLEIVLTHDEVVTAAYRQQVYSLFEDLKKILPTVDLIEGEIEVLKTISSIVNTTSVPHLPGYVANALQRTASVFMDPGQVKKSSWQSQLAVILSTILSLNEARLITKRTEESVLGEGGEERIVVKVVKELERSSILAPIVLKQVEKSG